MNTETRLYKDVSGNPCSLDWLVKHEPEWAENQIRHRDKLETELNQCVTALKAVANRKTVGDEFDARKLVAAALENTKSAAEPANDKAQR